MSKTRIAIDLELDHSCDLLAGSITRPDGVVTEFCGWTGLLEAIRALTDPEGAARSAATTQGANP